MVSRQQVTGQDEPIATVVPGPAENLDTRTRVPFGQDLAFENVRGAPTRVLHEKHPGNLGVDHHVPVEGPRLLACQ